MRISLIYLFAIFSMLVSSGCGSKPQVITTSQPTSSQSAQSSSVVLSKESVQRVVDRFISNNKGSGCSNEPCKAEVTNVREIPSQNQAVATVNFTSFVFKPGDKPQEYIYSGEGRATFDKGTDGVWSMSRMSFTKYGYERSWTEMRGYDVR
ncbi:hypothetical protein [Leptolyngbya sp. 7M]|uniref:hypothetical protein n=1 Tax=Leptolyngbya sp. 7M TaxID=2812896 RepID=UPI001B8D9DE4|nr:hypothetical protein [Leptolyngbya sp. 7M]QYO66694.1 hypothetical protein JVX88_07795 [Leptolyngbya sp. 7M]